MSLSRTLVGSIIALASTAAVARAGGVAIVGDPSQTSYSTIQAAIDAAHDGDVLLVGAGTYPAFTIAAHALSIFAAPNSLAQVNGNVQITNLAASQTVVLSGLHITSTGATGTQAPSPALYLLNDHGNVRVDHCAIRGLDLADEEWDGATAVRVVACTKVAISSSSVQGGSGGYGTHMTDPAGNGGMGLSVESFSSIALYDCSLIGGYGGNAPLECGDGGDGARASESALFASNTSFHGGVGGACVGGDGGHGLTSLNGSSAQLLDCSLVGGGSASSSFGNVVILPGSSRSLSAPSIGIEQANLTVHAIGESGDRLWLTEAFHAGFAPSLALSGVWLAPRPPLMTFAPQTTLPSSGSADFTIHLPLLGSQPARIIFAQGFARDVGGASWLGSPLHELVLARHVAPDCNGNGVSDLVDVIEGTAADCNGTLIPDDCEIAQGLVPDCNANLIPDSCDIANGTSLDANGDQIPDECEYSGPIFWVDASATPGGDGSASAPYSTIQPAIDHAVAGQIVRIRDGVYSGAGNVPFNFHGKALTVQSEHGPAACILECQQAASGVRFETNESNGARLEGLTIQNASTGVYANGAQPTISHCVIQNCGVNGYGAGIQIWNFVYYIELAPVIEDCVVAHNEGGTGTGAGVYTFGDVDLLVRRCVFEHNHAHGAAAISPSGRLRASHCSFIANVTDQAGTAYVGGAGALICDDASELVDCLFAGNRTDGRGGAVIVSSKNASYSYGSPLIEGCTFVGNSAQLEGGALVLVNSQRATIANCVLWNDSASSGAEIAMLAPTIAPAEMFVEVRYSDVAGGQAGVLVNFGTLTWGPGNLALDPLFVDADGPDNDPNTFDDNVYRLQSSSPCLDAGDNSWIAPDDVDIDGDGDVLEPNPLDLNLKPRRKDLPGVPDTGHGVAPLVDLGCYERQN